MPQNQPTAAAKERVLLALVDIGLTAPEPVLAELAALTETAGGEVVAQVCQKRDRLHGAFAVGTGKLAEIKAAVESMEIDTVIFDNALSGSQFRNLEKELGVKILDRGGLILDIFAGRARSVEGKLQVELAQLKYSLPRLIGAGGKMAKMRAGIGMRGPGETKLETDRRVIRRKIFELEQRIAKLAEERALRRERRVSEQVPSAALVGYTNAGKSTILNALSREKTFAEDMLFATLDPLTRRVRASDGRFYVITDTVGFIDRLPHELIDAFSSTLEEAREAGVLLHVVDISDSESARRAEVVDGVLRRLRIPSDNVLTVYNKIDKATAGIIIPKGDNSTAISALSGVGMDELRRKIEERLFGLESGQ